jgi:hypothetical protein
MNWNPDAAEIEPDVVTMLVKVLVDVLVKVLVKVFIDVLVDVTVVLVPASYTVVDARTIVSATKRPSSADLAFNFRGVESAGAS